MKNFIPFVITMFFVITFTNAQSYEFSQTTEPFEFLTNSTSINNGEIWSDFDMFEVPIGFPFNFMGVTFTSVTFEATGRLIFDPEHLFFADMVTILGMRDKGTSTSLSPLSYELTGVAGNQILKIEINNATYGGDSTVNYQIWLYEENNTIELHMGEYSSTFQNAAFSGIHYLSTFTPTTFVYSLSLDGNPLAPVELEFTGEGDAPFNTMLDDLPMNGVVYTFTDTSVLGTENDHVANNIKLYPNPVANELILGTNSSSEIHFIDIYTVLGSKIKAVQPSTESIQKINVDNLAKGIYVLVVTNFQNESTIHKFIKI